MNILAWLYWNPPREAFTIPFINRPVAWYGLFFVFGFLVGYPLMCRILKNKLSKSYPEQAGEFAQMLTERMTWFIVAGTVIGARLGHVFFYEWPRYQNHLLDIFKVWEGGLASHGGAIGVILALFLFRKTISQQFPQLSLISLLDMVSIPTAFVCFCIRCGNFINQEILGPPTKLPWGVIFGNPLDGSAPTPRHPTQLYEAGCYLAIFVLLMTLWYRWSDKLRPGMLIGLFFILSFGSRFLLEFLKTPMSMMFEEHFLQTGQILSLPFFIAGLFLFRYGSRFCVRQDKI